EVCNICTTVCPNLAFHSFEIEPVNYHLQKIISTINGVEVMDGDSFEIQQKHQILHLADWCNQCGNCDTFCPTAGAPYLEKPHLYLDKSVFEQEKDGYFLEVENENATLLFYQKNQKFHLSIQPEFIVFESKFFKAELESSTLLLLKLEVKEKTKFEADLTIAAGMKIILQGALDFYANE
ncbi:MAG: 4Fe-4S dicluster domain-containing protein, partial [Bacteroidales bacterium]|nr:4Fe-4S dicluster domain-containing protein [Bacteroidales bacterium]